MHWFVIQCGTPDLTVFKWNNEAANAPGARHASFRFVAGELDPMSTREEFLATVRRVTDPILVIYGAATPKRSKVEIEALAGFQNVQLRQLPVGKLAIHEEFPSLVADAVRPFLGGNSNDPRA